VSLRAESENSRQVKVDTKRHDINLCDFDPIFAIRDSFYRGSLLLDFVYPGTEPDETTSGVNPFRVNVRALTQRYTQQVAD
jgi:hypothetical protein